LSVGQARCAEIARGHEEGEQHNLRNSVIHRKVTGGYRSTWGAEASAILTTLLATARKRGDNLVDALRAVAGPSALQVAGTAT
jgi:hypothetical protein